MTRRRRQFQNAAENLRQADLDNIAHFEPRRETVGDMLRRAREGKGLEIAAVANQSRIRSGYLKAIEEGRFQDLPGLTYAVGFVRTYADHLGLDSEDVVRRFRDEVAELKGQTQLIFPVVATEGKIPRGAVLLLSAVLAAIAYGGWYYLSERDERPLDLIPALPDKLQELISGDSAAPDDPAPQSVPGAAPGATGDGVPAASSPATPPVTPSDPAPAQPMAPAGETPGDAAAPATTGAATTGQVAPAAPGVAAAPEAPQPATDPATDPATGSATPAPATPDASQSAAAPAAPVPVPAPADPAPPSVTAPDLDASGLPTVAAPAAPSSANVPGIAAAPDAAGLPPVAEGEVFGATEGGARIVLVARLESWIQVTDPETNALLTRVLRAGDRYYVPAETDLTLATGNAGGLDIWVDGRKAPALGPVGVVRRGIALDAVRLQNGTALPE